MENDIKLTKAQRKQISDVVDRYVRIKRKSFIRKFGNIILYPAKVVWKQSTKKCI